MYGFAHNCDWMQVAIRVRPPLLRELEGYQPFQNTALVDTRQTILTVSENLHAIQNGGSAADAGLVRPCGSCCTTDIVGDPPAVS